MSKEKIEKILDQNENIITYKADKDFRGLTSLERTLLENNKKIKEYIDQLEQENENLRFIQWCDTDRINQLKQENKKQSKIIDEMEDAIVGDRKILALICKNIINKTDEECTKQNLLCDDCIKQYFEKKVEEK